MSSFNTQSSCTASKSSDSYEIDIKYECDTPLCQNSDVTIAPVEDLSTVPPGIFDRTRKDYKQGYSINNDEGQSKNQLYFYNQEEVLNQISDLTITPVENPSDIPDNKRKDCSQRYNISYEKEECTNQLRDITPLVENSFDVPVNIADINQEEPKQSNGIASFKCTARQDNKLGLNHTKNERELIVALYRETKVDSGSFSRITGVPYQTLKNWIDEMENINENNEKGQSKNQVTDSVQDKNKNIDPCERDITIGSVEDPPTSTVNTKQKDPKQNKSVRSINYKTRNNKFNYNNKQKKLITTFFQENKIKVGRLSKLTGASNYIVNKWIRETENDISKKYSYEDRKIAVDRVISSYCYNGDLPKSIHKIAKTFDIPPRILKSWLPPHIKNKYTVDDKQQAIRLHNHGEVSAQIVAITLGIPLIVLDEWLSEGIDSQDRENTPDMVAPSKAVLPAMHLWEALESMNDFFEEYNLPHDT